MLSLDMPLRSVKGIGPQRASALAKLGYRTVEDLLYHLPFRYEDRSRFAPLAGIATGERISFLASIRSSRLIRTRRRGFTIFQAVLDDGSAAIPAVWFNQPYLEKSLTPGRAGFFYGELRLPRSGRAIPRFENPQFEAHDPDDPEPVHTGRIVPVYERIGSLTGRQVRSFIHYMLASEEAGPAAEEIGTRGFDDRTGGKAAPMHTIEFLPQAILRRHALPSRADSLREVHFPSGAQSTEWPEVQAVPRGQALDPDRERSDIQPAVHIREAPTPRERLDSLNDRATPWHRRLIFEEFFSLQVGLALRRSELRREERGFAYETSPRIREKLKSILPFRLTDGQKRVLREIVDDLRSPYPMNRLLQGDVGSGKTIVAVLAMALAAENGVQSALMAPTEILAEQHARSIGARLAPAGYKVVLLTSAVKGPARRERLAALASGAAHVAVGTHALVQKGVAFKRLGFVVVDEQHRFGVLQRATLREKGRAPDTLVMTATPIPRTLALTVYGDLDHSTLDEMPPGRTTVKTLLRSETDRPRLYAWMREAIARGRQAFIVYPLVEEKENSGLRAAKAMVKRLAAEVFTERRVGLVHGQMKSAEKEKVMAAFREGAIAILVATTVVEVGIDVPNATILVVEHAERFGLSQLHQLRGRVGRGRAKSTCVLMVGENLTAAGTARLDALEKESSGFRLAEIDLDIRGPGAIFGTRQSGLPDLRIGNLVRDRDLMEAARREAIALVAPGGGLDSPGVREIMNHMRPAWLERFRLSNVG